MQIDMVKYQVKLVQGQLLFSQGDRAECCYIVKTGALEIFIIDSHGKKVVLGNLGKSDVFGDMALILDSERTASCRAITESEVYFLNRENLMEIIRSRPEFAVKLIEVFRERLISINNRLVFSGTRDTIYSSSGDNSGEIMSRNTMKYPAGSIIFREFEKGHCGYIIKRGRVKLVRLNQVQKKESLLAVAGPGEIFGELALLGSSERIATAVSDADETELIVFDEKNFFHMIYNDSEFCMKILKICCQRLKSMNEKLSG